MHFFFENIAPPSKFLKIVLNVPRFLRCLQILRFFFWSDLKWSPFFSQNTLFVTYHGHSKCFHCGNQPSFQLNLKKKNIFCIKSCWYLPFFFPSVQIKKRNCIPILANWGFFPFFFHFLGVTKKKKNYIRIKKGNFTRIWTLIQSRELRILAIFTKIIVFSLEDPWKMENC